MRSEIRGFDVGGSEARARTQLLQLPYILSVYVACGAETVAIFIGYDIPYRHFRYDGPAAQRVGSYSNTSVKLTPGKEWLGTSIMAMVSRRVKQMMDVSVSLPPLNV